MEAVKKARSFGRTPTALTFHQERRMSDDSSISRSRAIEKLAIAPIAIGALAALREAAEAAPTMDQKAASYVTHPNDGKQCSKCSLYIPAKSNPSKTNGTCQLVKGSISPHGYCKFFQAKS
jgi:hypothetical protein